MYCCVIVKSYLCSLVLATSLCLCFWQYICVAVSLCLSLCPLFSLQHCVFVFANVFVFCCVTKFVSYFSPQHCVFVFANVFVFCCVIVFVSFFSPQHCVFFLLGPCVSASVGEVCLALSPGSEIIIDQYHHNYYRQIITFEPLEACNQSLKNDWNSRWPCRW